MRRTLLIVLAFVLAPLSGLGQAVLGPPSSVPPAAHGPAMLVSAPPRSVVKQIDKQPPPKIDDKKMETLPVPLPVYQSTGAAAQPIDLPTALQLADGQNPEIALARERIREALALQDRADALWL